MGGAYLLGKRRPMLSGLGIQITIDWEGLSLQSQSLERLQSFRQRWQVPITHFMNPAYFTHPLLQGRAKEIRFRDVIVPGDQWGLHLHGTKHFVDAAGVSFQSSPSFSGRGDGNPGFDRGHEVMLHTYDDRGLHRLLAFALRIFREQGFPRPLAFRAGGWMMNPQQFSVLEALGFQIDSSAAPAGSLDGSCWERDQLQRLLSILWPQVTEFSQPYTTEGSSVLEVPNNLGAIDYWTDEGVLLHAKRALAVAHTQPHLIVITGHQETAIEHLDKLDRFLELVLSQTDVAVEFLTSGESQKYTVTEESSVRLSS